MCNVKCDVECDVKCVVECVVECHTECDVGCVVLRSRLRLNSTEMSSMADHCENLPFVIQLFSNAKYMLKMKCKTMSSLASLAERS